jgi:D-glycero-alpha-D-manno-heptose 1-phosphate guanylyltransferase
METTAAHSFSFTGIEPSSSSLDVPAFLLVGGMGTRLRSVVASMPKPLAEVGSRSFLELLIRQLQSQGISRLVMCTGYLADQIENKFRDGQDWGVEIRYSSESRPLGTAGALKLAATQMNNCRELLVMNGDSFLEVDCRELIRFHREHSGVATMAVIKVENAGRYGTVCIDGNGRVTDFFEKTERDSPGMINAGVYVFDRSVLECIPEGPASLEKEVFPKLVKEGIHAFTSGGMFIDIGTPEDYAKAQHLYSQLCEAAKSKPNLPPQQK